MFFNNKFNIVRTTILCVLYVGCSLLQTLLAMGIIQFTHLLGFITPTSFNGCVSAIKLSLVILIVICSNGRHSKLAIIIQLINVSYMFIGMIESRNLESIPGIFLVIFGIISCYLLDNYLNKVQQNEKDLDRAAYVDPLTNCLNRRGLIRELNVKASLGKEFYLIFLDLDNFKQVNDLLGHNVGDELLTDISSKWSSLPFDNYILSRLGGDEFAMIVESDSKQYMNIFIKAVLKAMGSINPKFSSIITASAGIAHHTKDTSNVKQLLIYADTAMYNAKKSGKNTYCYFDKKAYRELERRYLTEEDLRFALANNTFEILYQPQFDITNKKIIGLEALLRMRGKDREFVNTQEFINVAEKSGLIYDIDLWVIKNTLLRSMDFIKKHPDVVVSVNVSGKHVIAPDFLEYVLECLEKSKFPPTNLKIEITESSYLKNLDAAVKVANDLKKLGITIALDDFGTGYSSLAYLARIPFDLLKIDKSFIDNIELEKQKANFVDVIIKLGHLMNCKVIAEGVENDEQLDTLVVLGCDYIQGFLWGKPETLMNIESIISNS